MKTLIEKPVIIIGCPRSGTTLLLTLLSQSKEMYSLFNESRFIFKKFYLQEEKKGVSYPDDSLGELGKEDVSLFLEEFHKYAFNSRLVGLGLQKVIRKKSYLKFLENPIVNINASVKNTPYRFVEKTPRNCFKIPAFSSIFPDARFIFLVRDGKTNISSLIDGWRKRKGGKPRYPALNKPLNIKGYEGSCWHFALPPGWEDYSERSLEEVCAYQWIKSNDVAISDLAQIPPERKMILRYEDLCDNMPGEIKKTCDFSEIEYSKEIRKIAEKPPVVNTFSKPSKDKWKRNQGLIENIYPMIEPMMNKLNYEI